MPVIEYKQENSAAEQEAKAFARKSGRKVVEVRSDGENVHLVIR